MYKSILLFSWLFVIPIFSQPTISIQTLLDNRDIYSLDSSNTDLNSQWYLREGNLREDEIKNITEENFLNLNWKRANVPGNVIKSAPELEGKKDIFLAKWIQFPSDKDNNLTFRLGVINDKDRTYLNGKLIGKTGNWDSDLPESYDKIRIYPIPYGVIKSGQKNLLLIHIKPYFDYTVGIEQDATSVGPSNLIFSKFYRDEFLKLIFLTVYLTFGSYFLFLFLRRRRDRENLFFALFSFSLVIYNFLRNQIKYELNIPFVYMKEFEYIILISLIPLMYHFLRNLFNFKYHLFGKILDGLQLSFVISFIVYQNIEFYNLLMSKLIQPTWFFYLCIIAYILFKNLKEKDRRAIYVSLGISIVLVASIIDILSTRGYFVFPRLLGYTFLAFNVSLAIILANSFVKLNEEVEDLNKNLEEKVSQRTDALNESLNQLKILKEKQDGDYFLTSLLIQPLAKNENNIPNIKIETYVDQKKKFHFRGKEGEIGGDICIIGNITLTSGNYTVFVNGDAMGKSIQGAGGALVLGVVFQAVLSRTKSSYTKQRPPELWLKDLYVELQSVFVSFDGSMLSSVVLGLISETTGFLYYINLEHPWNILYRDGVASFLETELSMRKLGFPKNDESFQIKTFSFLEGDVLIVGSDGRDDIGLGITEEGRNINEDETLILKLVENAKSNLQNLVGEIKSMGEITDDLSLLRIEYHPISNEEPIENRTKELIQSIKKWTNKKLYDKALEAAELILGSETHSKILSIMGKVYFKAKQWEKAADTLTKASIHFPDKEELIYLSAVSNYKADRIYDATLHSERLFLRNKFHEKNKKLFFHLLEKSNNEEKIEYYSRFLKTN